MPTAVSGTSLQAGIERLLSEYEQARLHDEFSGQHPLWQLSEAMAERITESAAVARYPTMRAVRSVGMGNWAKVPWISILDSRETNTTQEGVYPVLLFRQDMTGAYIVLGQGVTKPKKDLGASAGLQQLRSLAERIRVTCSDLADHGFALDGNIDMRADPGLGKDYEAAIIAHKFYERGAVPSDEQITGDLAALTAAYDHYIHTKGGEPSQLDALVEQFKRENGYPGAADEAHLAARTELADALALPQIEAIIEDPTRIDELQIPKLASQAYGGPGSQSRVHQGLISGGEDAARRLGVAIRHLLHTPADVESRLDDVLTRNELKAYGFGEGLATKCLAIVEPDRWLPVFQYRGDKGKKRLLQLPELALDALDETDKSPGQLAAESNDRLRERLEPYFAEDPWGQKQFLYWLRDRQGDRAKLGLTKLADDLLLPEEWLAEVIDVLRFKRQIIFYGPPGTGKTYVARALADYVAGDPSRRKVVQFHPSYAYEDFVEGYRPTGASDSGGVRFELKPGPFRELAEAADKSEHDWVLLIDEINRGNIAKIFGELYYLLEYRDDSVDMQYGDSFQLPRNLYVIGTMNTADRSIALLDAALRRRFHFVEFFPDKWPFEGLLRRWLTRHRPDMEYVAALVDRVNGMLPDRHQQLGPSHFMTTRLDASWLQKIWQRSVIPYLEEQFFDEPDRVDDFALDAISAAAGPTPASDGSGGAGEAVTPEVGEGGDGYSTAADVEGVEPH